MFFTSASIGLILAALAAWALFRALRERRRISSRVQVVVLASLVTVAFVAHLGLLDRDDTGAVLIRLPSPHDHELFHYAIGTRYFAELGYTGLYTATVVADFEDEPERFRPDAVARDLATYRPTTRREMLEHAASVKASFTPERWEAFKADLSPLREAHDPQRWHEGAYTSDHGYNATPLVTSVLGGLGRLFDPGTFLGLAPLLDPYLLALLALAVSALEGAAAALSLLFFLFANPMNEYAFVGGGYLRNGYLVALAAAFATLRAGRLAPSGAFFAVAGWLRIFPLAFPAALLARDALAPDRRARLRERRGLYISFALSSLLIFVGTSFQATPDGRNPWLSFADNIALHSGSASANRIGLAVPFGYSREKDRHTEARTYTWAEQTVALQAERRPARLAVVALLAAFTLVRLRRGGDDDTFLAAVLGIFALVPLSHYYYAVLGLLPLLIGSDSRRLAVLAMGFAMLAITAWPGWLERELDLRFTLFSLEIGALLVCLLWLGRRGGARAPT